jgi:nucleotide-binding universal stress UspA family protein
VKTSDADLLVVGSRGLGAFSRMIIGSTSTKLVHICERPVLVVP